MLLFVESFFFSLKNISICHFQLCYLNYVCPAHSSEWPNDRNKSPFLFSLLFYSNFFSFYLCWSSVIIFPKKSTNFRMYVLHLSICPFPFVRYGSISRERKKSYYFSLYCTVILLSTVHMQRKTSAYLTVRKIKRRWHNTYILGTAVNCTVRFVNIYLSMQPLNRPFGYF